jgi:hypothetical protein
MASSLNAGTAAQSEQSRTPINKLDVLMASCLNAGTAAQSEQRGGQGQGQGQGQGDSQMGWETNRRPARRRLPSGPRRRNTLFVVLRLLRAACAVRTAEQDVNAISRGVHG